MLHTKQTLPVFYINRSRKKHKKRPHMCEAFP
jgi:hypothetical protein